MSETQPKKDFFSDAEFYTSPEARSLRILSEYFGPRQRFSRNHIEDTIVFFGSARLVSKQKAEQALKKASKSPSRQMRKKLEHDLTMSQYYEDSKALAKKLTYWSKKRKNSKHRYIITSGGGPGIMEAANRGASEAKGLTIGLNITVPHEQSGNKWLTPELCMEFHYFFMRKFWMAYLAKALVVFPGGFGTLDELMEILTLIQTKKIKKSIPIVLYGKNFWDNTINWEYLIKAGTVSKKDLDLFTICDSVEDAFTFLTTKITGTHTGPNF